MARVEDKALLYEYKMQVLRKEHIKGLFDCGYLYNADIEAICKNIAKLENLILRRMSRTKEGSNNGSKEDKRC